MITFLICLALLITAYFTYGKFLERIIGVKNNTEVPSKVSYDGVDYIPLPRWKIFLIQLLNIAGLGPIFGAILGAAYGPVAFLWITLGGIFMGAMHDFLSGYMSLKNNGCSLHQLANLYLGKNTKIMMSLFTGLLMIMVGAVFMSQPAVLINNLIHYENPFFTTVAIDNNAGIYTNGLLIILACIFVYYIVATILPIDKIIGNLYPVFGILLLIMAFGMLYAIFFEGYGAKIPELTTLQNMNASNLPIFPMLFTTIACGALSGFHATQSPLMARCISNEKQARGIFYGAMISESIIALVWAAIGMAFWGSVQGLNGAIAQYNGSAALLVTTIANTTLGKTLAALVTLGIIACAITSGDTAFRSARLIFSDLLKINQTKSMNRIMVALPIFILSLIIILLLPFQTMWSYFAWLNQTLAVFTLWTITSWLNYNNRLMNISAIPAIFMTFICSSYIFISPLMFGMQNRVLGLILGAVLTLIIMIMFIYKIRMDNKSRNLTLRAGMTIALKNAREAYVMK